jgi:hypothetical protein
MANAPSITTANRNRAADAVTARANSGYLRIYDGTAPASANASLSGNTLLAELTFGNPAFGAASSGVATANAITGDASNNASGTATFFRIYESDGATVVLQGSVGTSGCDLNLTTTTITSGGTTDVSSLTYTQQGS